MSAAPVRPAVASAPRAAATLLAASLLGAASARAQQAPVPARRAVTQTASINLLGLPFGFFSGEYERAIGTSGFAVGVGGLATFTDGDYADAYGNTRQDGRFASLQVKFKYYPSANGLRGFAVGVTAGAASARGYENAQTGESSYTPPGSDTAYFFPVYSTRRLTLTRPTVGATLDYNFLIGRQRRFLIGLGLGARRVLGDRNEVRTINGVPVYRSNALDRTIPDGRLQIGFGF